MSILVGGMCSICCHMALVLAVMYLYMNITLMFFLTYFFQNLVGAFVDVHHQSMARVRTLEEETASLRQHVNSLKRELSDAVHREFNEQVRK